MGGMFRFAISTNVGVSLGTSGSSLFCCAVSVRSGVAAFVDGSFQRCYLWAMWSLTVSDSFAVSIDWFAVLVSLVSVSAD